jgi:hypothetical protein
VGEGWRIEEAYAREEALPGKARASDGDATRSRRANTPAPAAGPGVAPAPVPRPPSRHARLSKDAYRRQKAVIDDDLTRLGLRRSHLELALHDPSIAANFVELRRVTSELADVEQALAAAEETWLLLEERAP